MFTGDSSDELLVVMAKGKNELRVWQPGSRNPVQKIKGYPNLDITSEAKFDLKIIS